MSSPAKQMKYIVVSGGVISGIGKGIIASSTGLLLKSYGLNVTAIKVDPYLNIDAGLMNPMEHGEVFVLNDGGEVDLDLGNYERFLDTTLYRENNITTGKIYNHVIQKERKGDYLGKTVQVVPHITDAIQDWVEKVAHRPTDETNVVADVCIIELGGTVGDIESAPFIEAMRQFQFRVGHENFCLMHVSLVPVVGEEQKTKPTQASVRDLRGLGLSPDLIMCRCTEPVGESIKNKISMFCHVASTHVFGVHNCKTLYHVPIILHEQGIIDILRKRLNLGQGDMNGKLLNRWRNLAVRSERLFDVIKIAIVGKYTELHDSYASVVKSLEHAAVACNRKLEILWIEADTLEKENEKTNSKAAEYHQAWHKLLQANGILVPGGFGSRGIEGKILAAKYARTNNIPYLGICLGLQTAVIEFARNVLGLEGANSTEVDPNTPHPLVINMPEISTTQLGGTMRLGKRNTVFVIENSMVQSLYGGQKAISERHRHRYEVNTEYLPRLQEKGLMFVGHDEQNERMEIFELKNHKYYVGCQFHPEYKTRPLSPSPVFLGLILAATDQLHSYLAGQSKNEFYSNEE